MVREWEENTAGVLYESGTYLLGPSGPMYKRPASAAYVRWYVYNGLGPVVGEVDVNGLLIAEKKYDVFGLRRGTVGTQSSRHGFVGGHGHYSDDETRLVYMQARYYDTREAKHGKYGYYLRKVLVAGLGMVIAVCSYRTANDYSKRHVGQL